LGRKIVKWQAQASAASRQSLVDLEPLAVHTNILVY